MKNVHTQTTPFTKKLGADNLRRTLALVQSMWELLDGENPMRIEHLWQKVFRALLNAAPSSPCPFMSRYSVPRGSRASRAAADTSPR